MRLDKMNRFFCKKFLGIGSPLVFFISPWICRISAELLLSAEIWIPGDELFIVGPEVGWIMVMGMALAKISEEKIKTLFVRNSRGTRAPQSPFS